MSVLNTMLRDLERRGATPPQRPAHGDAPRIVAPAPAPAAAEAPPRSRVRPALLLAAVAAALASVWLWKNPAPRFHLAIPLLTGGPAATAGTPPKVALPALEPPAVAPGAAPAAPAPAEAPNAEAGRASPVKPAEARSAQPVQARTPVRIAVREHPAPVPAAEAPSQPAAVAAEAPAVAPSAARSELARAMELVDRGRGGEAAQVLAAAVSQRPDWSEARSALAALQSDAGDRRQALATLLEGVPFDPARFAPTAAQLQAELNDPAAALSTLDRVPAGSRDPAYHALAAAVAQRAGQHELAVAEYGATLRSVPGNAVAWVGLGVSLQALGRDAQALAAYQNAAGTKLGAELRGFVESRIRELRARPVRADAPTR